MRTPKTKPDYVLIHSFEPECPWQVGIKKSELSTEIVGKFPSHTDAEIWMRLCQEFPAGQPKNTYNYMVNRIKEEIF